MQRLYTTTTTTTTTTTSSSSSISISISANPNERIRAVTGHIGALSGGLPIKAI